MAVDTPAKIVIIGAGPVGLEAALYARFLGYDVVLFERGRIGEHWLRWGHARLFSPFAVNRSPLAVAAIAAHDEAWLPPADDALLTNREFVAHYLEPLAQTDLLSDSLRLGHEVLAIGREGFLKGDSPGSDDRGAFDFRVLVRDASGREFIEPADVVIDASGVCGQPNWLGSSGIPAVGEQALCGSIEYGLADVLGAQRERYAARHTLVIGSGYSAAMNVVALAELAKEAANTRVTWLTRRERPAGLPGPMRVITDDPLPARSDLAHAANRCCADNTSGVVHWPLTDVEAITKGEGETFQVELSGEHEGTYAFDRILANVGYRPDRKIHEELHVPERTDYSQPPAILLPEANFYLLGSKSYGRDSSFTLAAGHQQIVDLFAIIGDRATLNLYAGMTRLPK